MESKQNQNSRNNCNEEHFNYTAFARLWDAIPEKRISIIEQQNDGRYFAEASIFTQYHLFVDFHENLVYNTCANPFTN